VTTTEHTPTIWIDVPGGRLAADDEGSGPPILLIHSAIVNRRSWDPVAPLLIEAGYRVIRYDMRGFGESTTDDVEYAPNEDAVAVLDHFAVGKAAIGGNSMGGSFALETVLESPDRFVAFAWIGGGISGYEKGVTPEEDALFHAESEAEKAGDWDLAAELDTQIWVDGVGQPTTRVDPAVRAAIKAWDRELLEPGRVYGSFRRPEPAAGRLGTVAIPTLAVIGELDTMGTRAAADKLAAEVPGARIAKLPNVAHIVGMEVPETLAGLIVELLAPLPRWS
jgi:pimeloyl-ACP methyl ester carboxylesterase